MHSEIVTTITTRIDLDTFTPMTSMQVDCEDDLPRSVIYAAVSGACRAAAGKADEMLNHQPVAPESLGDEDGEDEQP